MLKKIIPGFRYIYKGAFIIKQLGGDGGMFVKNINISEVLHFSVIKKWDFFGKLVLWKVRYSHFDCYKN